VAGASLFGRVGTLLGASSQTQDVRVLSLALRLEYTEAAFYAEALANGILSDELRTYAEAVLAHEEEHVGFLRQALGSDAPDRPSFDFGRATRDPDAFTRTAITLEDLAVAGYNGQATNLTPATLAAAAKIVSVEARHAAWIREIAGQVAAPDAVDAPVTAAQLEEGLARIGMGG
jgi:rubrerythrin